MFKLLVEMTDQEISAGDKVISKSPGSKGLKGKVLTINKSDSVVVQFDNGKKLSVPLSHLWKTQE